MFKLNIHAAPFARLGVAAPANARQVSAAKISKLQHAPQAAILSREQKFGPARGAHAVRVADQNIAHGNIFDVARELGVSRTDARHSPEQIVER